MYNFSVNFPAILSALTDLIYPPSCICCGKEIAGEDLVATDHATGGSRKIGSPASHKPASFCQECAAALQELVDTPTCSRCSAPVGEGGSCPRCRGRGLFPFERIVALAPFRPPLRSLVHHIKFHHRWPLAEVLADQLLHHEPAAELLERTDVLVAIPLHWSRQIVRGYNQAAAVAQQLSRRTGLPVVVALRRIENTQPQTNLHSRQARQLNVRRAFGLNRGNGIRGKRVTLIDDVTTTGATLHAAAVTLGKLEPSSISALVLAIADPRRRDFQLV